MLSLFLVLLRPLLADGGLDRGQDDGGVVTHKARKAHPRWRAKRGRKDILSCVEHRTAVGGAPPTRGKLRPYQLTKALRVNKDQCPPFSSVDAGPGQFYYCFYVNYI